jgi:acyl-CoA thioesterase II
MSSTAGTDLGSCPDPQGTAAGLPGLLALERIEDDLFRSSAVSQDPRGLYGGQVAALALRAAAETVPPGRLPHSLHGYFLSRGDAAMRVLLTVSRDRDGGSYSNRRVVAVQHGRVIFNMAASFHVTEDGADYQATQAPEVAAPEDLPTANIGHRLHGVEVRIPRQPSRGQHWPSRVWMRAQHSLDRDIMHACALAYISDMFSGLAAVPDIALAGPLTSIDHAVWFYRKVALDDWVLMDLQPESTAGGRGMYRGRIFGRDGTLAAGLAQESLFRPGNAVRRGPLAQ